MSNNLPLDRLPVLVAGVRTPFLDSAGLYSTLMSFQLGAAAIRGLVEKTGNDTNDVGVVIMGTVLHEVETTNCAREAMLAAGLPSRIPAYTVAMAGISPTVGVMNICDQVATGRLKEGIASGTENFSDIPIRLSQKIRRSLMKLRQRKTTADRLAVIKTLRPWDLLKLEVPSSSDYTTGLSMGVACEAMVKKFGITREDCDQFAARSHQLAAQATKDGFYAPQLIKVKGDDGVIVEADNSIRADTTAEKLAKLPAVFDRENGIITPGTASRFTDGATAMLISSYAHAKAKGQQPLAVIRDYLLAGVDSLETEMLLGPAMTIPRLLKQNGLGYDDIDVWEIHEAFAAQVLVNRACMADEKFVAERFDADTPVGLIPMEKLNTWGGSLSLGNPFAATGGRLFLTAAQRLQQSCKRYAVISTCAGGGLGAAVLLENPAFIEG